MNPASLEEKKVLVKSKATALATNEDEYIAIGVGKFILFYYFDIKKLDFLPLSFGDKTQIHVNDDVIRLEWNKDILGIMTKADYMIIERKNVVLRGLCHNNNANFPNLLAFEDRWLCVVDDSIAFFSSVGKPLFDSELSLNEVKERKEEEEEEEDEDEDNDEHKIYGMFIYGCYLLVVKESFAEVYNLHDNKKPRKNPDEHAWKYEVIQRIELDQGWFPANREFDLRVYTIDGANIYVLGEADHLFNDDEGTMILYWQLMPYEQRMMTLFKEGKLETAWDLYVDKLRELGKAPEEQKDQFKLYAGWDTIKTYEFEKSEQHFLEVNYDIREVLLLMPDLIKTKSPHITLRELLNKTLAERKRLEGELQNAQEMPLMIEIKGEMIENEARPIKIDKLERKIEKLPFKATEAEHVFTAGKRLLIRLTEEVRRRLQAKYNFNTDGGEVLSFVRSEKQINRPEFPEQQTLEEIITYVDTNLLKMYVMEVLLQDLYNFVTTVEVLKCDHDEMDRFIKEREGKDKTFTEKVCLGLLEYRRKNYLSALEIWKNLGHKSLEIRNIGCKETCKILKTHIKDKRSVFTYARMVLVLNPEEGLKIFTENEGITSCISEDDTIDYLKGFESLQPKLRERYLEYLTCLEDSQERFFTVRAQLYVDRIKKKEDFKNKLQSPDSLKNRESLYKFILETDKYNPRAILDEIKDIGFYDEEVHLYTIQKLYDEALDSYMKKHCKDFNFSEVEEYCLRQPEPLLALLFKKVLNMCEEKRRRMEITRSNEEVHSNLKREYRLLQNYLKDFLKKYATNDNMRADEVLDYIPDDWKMTTEENDDALLDYLIMAYNYKQGKEINAKITQYAKEMQKLDADATLAKLQSSYIMVSPENMCRVCKKKLTGAKSLYIFPNGIVTHTACGKDPQVCPVTKVKFVNRIFK
eukprot:TRINITY_DN2934_c0_g2_i1.p1 TRINITY_DN2934_c0_g2~~TRINITY_DN2934_c0_g2_i1.p1  ORF type:complete len:922 (-),score=323.30 TRINITY_DN2934_c0_g2_i1:94-2859(-)